VCDGVRPGPALPLRGAAAEACNSSSGGSSKDDNDSDDAAGDCNAAIAAAEACVGPIVLPWEDVGSDDRNTFVAVALALGAVAALGVAAAAGTLLLLRRERRRRMAAEARVARLEGWVLHGGDSGGRRSSRGGGSDDGSGGHVDAARDGCGHYEQP